MKRVRPGRWSGQLLAARPSHTGPSPAGAFALANGAPSTRPCGPKSQARLQTTSVNVTALSAEDPILLGTEFPSPLPERALGSAKLAALHSRLSLPEKLPLQTLARTLIDRTADNDPRFNNFHLAYLGNKILKHQVSEWLICRYPRLPLHVVGAAQDGYIGDESLASVGRSWGVELAAAPGGEVDPGLLQYAVGTKGMGNKHFSIRDYKIKSQTLKNWRLAMTSQPIPPCEPLPEAPESEDAALMEKHQKQREEDEELSLSLRPNGSIDKKLQAWSALSGHVRAVVGAVYAHCGREEARNFVRAHILSRQLNLWELFGFKRPTLELARLCAREDFEEPTARLLSETGRRSRTPVFLVGIFSGADKLGEGSGPNPREARANAAMNALKAWYLYSPGPDVRLPSDMLDEGAKPWEPAYVDVGQIIN